VSVTERFKEAVARAIPTSNGARLRLFLVLGLTNPIARGDPLPSAAASASSLFVLDGYFQPFLVDFTSPKVTVAWVESRASSEEVRPGASGMRPSALQPPPRRQRDRRHPSPHRRAI